MPHKFTIGDNVEFLPAIGRTIDAARGLYVVTMQLPDRDGEFEYRIRSPDEPHERPARESELRGA
jgi:hypothetical protein